MQPTEIQHALGLSDEIRRWLDNLKRPDSPPRLVLPDDAQALALLEHLQVEPIDQTETLEARPNPETQPALWSILERCYHDMIVNMGHGESIHGFSGWPALPAELGMVGRYLYVWLYLAVVPDVRRYHAEHGIEDAYSWQTLQALAKNMAAHRIQHGVGGLGLWGQWGLPLYFRGANYELGRLGYNRGEITFLGRPHSYVLNVHIPPLGPVDAAACDASFAQARTFFAQHFSDEPVSFALCHSWLMDEQLAQYLSPTSNLLQFQRRFHLVPEHTPPISDHDILHYVFGQHADDSEIPQEMLDVLPQDTSLRRAFVAHLRAGKHWHARTGWLAWEE